ncbi:hypothetical protein [Anaerosinus gibii]|uniref:Uncharacterized protein n=1 Tax=Selenobaculum gibii TaxID=3054208 RepID=A0A9Y2ERH0_9FIRM|nr:hypothetical protein [Selenobaculum gbiensis]WIW69813.1 hypothetical protein P3F81_07760 [Selenobaculum gbiensis]
MNPITTEEINDSVNVSLSSEAKNLQNATMINARYSPSYTMQQVIHNSYDLIRGMYIQVSDFVSKYDQRTGNDKYNTSSDLKTERDDLWYGTNSQWYTSAEWDQFGMIVNGKKVITGGNDSINKTMTEFFNDPADLYTKNSAQKYKGLLERVLNCISAYK